MQASRFECLSFDPFALLWNSFVASEVDVSGCDLVDALVIPLVIVVVDEGFGSELQGHRVTSAWKSTLERFEGTAHDSLARTDDEEYKTQTRKLSL